MKLSVSQGKSHARFTPKGIIFANDAFYPVIDGVVRIVDKLHSHYLSHHIPSYVVCSHYPNYEEQHPNIIRIPSLPIANNYRVAIPILFPTMLSKIDPDTISLVHLHAPFFVGRYVRNWALKHRKPVIITYHSKFDQKFKNSLPPAFVKPSYKFTLDLVNKCDMVTTPTESFRQVLISHGIKADKCVVVHHGVPPIPALDPNSPKIAEDNTLRTLAAQKKQGKVILLYVGQIIKEKNPDFLIRALFELKKQKFPFYCVIVGIGDQYHALQSLIRKLKLTASVCLAGRIMEPDILHAIYASADLFTFPSTYETQGMVVLEAAQHGVPTVGITDATGISDFVHHNKTGYLTPLCAEVYAQGIINAWNNQPLYQRVCTAAKKEIPVSSEEMIAGFESIYARLCH